MSPNGNAGNTQTAQNAPPNTEQNDAGTRGENFEQWLQTQPEDVRKAYEAHTSGLKRALQTERETRSNLEKRLKRIARGDDIPDAVKTQLEELSREATEARRKATFVAEAARRFARYPDLLYQAAQDLVRDEEDLKSDLLWERLRKQYPDLFRPAEATTSRGGDAGAQGNSPNTPSIDDLIRRAARR